MLSYVVAVSRNNVIGKNNSLAWRLPDDVKFFREKTLSETKTMIMGRKTFESLPKVLPGRKHIVYTRDKNYKIDDPNVEIIHTIDEILPYAKSDQEYFVIGGGEIFKMLFPYTQRMYLTEIHENFEGDTFFPDYDKSQWKVTEKKEGTIDEKNIYPHTYLTLERV
ncbi:dihydrofolate reductase [Oxobacter pfennigii]|uniref:Dihydrofolate reductase n=1 Tax=Oxobacter pfennigii TaxID=36849 RepID=A0A0P8W5D7_9CLOT|nr:dihydrofolate reductase [Oxobacter pfennigii]KPU43130.1 dihydrofolate reductase [Oxobacter pfennigii]